MKDPKDTERRDRVVSDALTALTPLVEYLAANGHTDAKLAVYDAMSVVLDALGLNER